MPSGHTSKCILTGYRKEAYSVRINYFYYFFGSVLEKIQIEVSHKEKNIKEYEFK